MSGTLKPAAKKKMPTLAGPGPSVKPGGVMVPPEPKNANEAPPPAAEEPATLMGMIASLSPWAEARPRGPRLGSVCRAAGGARVGAACPVRASCTPPLTHPRAGGSRCAGADARGRGG